MEKELFLNARAGSPSPLSYIASEKRSNYFLNLNWDQNSSALSSIVTSPTASNATVHNESFVMTELIGKLGNISKLPHTFNTTSCYTNSPPKLQLSMNTNTMDHYLQVSGNSSTNSAISTFFPGDPGFAERAARFSSLHLKDGLLGRSSTPENAESSNAGDESSPSRHILHGLKDFNEASFRKRKPNDLLPPSCGGDEAKEAEEDEAFIPKRSKLGKTTGNKPDKSAKQMEESPKPLPEAPKDYIHVRARRGQATDSHSLSERVRREKISERMKLLQDLVPGCNKITGKAVMLNEIINYVQSLQCQVEFLSMKIATVNPSMETLPSKDILESQTAFSYSKVPRAGAPLHTGHETQCFLNYMDTALSQNFTMQSPAPEGFGEASSQLATFWENDLHTVVQSSQSFHDHLSTSQMKH